MSPNNEVNFHTNDAQPDKGEFELNPNGKFSDVNAKDAYEVDLKPHVKVIGMPNPNINHNTSTDCYGEY